MTEQEIRAINLRMAALCGYPVVGLWEAEPADQSFVRDWGSGLTWNRVSHGYCVGYGDWSPATNPTQALEVAEALRAEPRHYMIEIRMDSRGTRVYVYNRDRDQMVAKHSSPLREGAGFCDAICGAAAETAESEVGR